MKKISIIMVCKNSEQTIAKSIYSFINQDYQNKELIIVDGGSSDGTLEIIDSFKENNSISVYKKKNLGLYASINEGIKISKGKLIGILHSDDLYYDEKVLTKVVNGFSDIFIGVVYTDIVFINSIGKVKRKWTNSDLDNSSSQFLNLPPHTGLYVKKEIFDIIGYYNENYNISSDIEFMYKLFRENKVKKKYLNFFSLKMLLGGLSTKTPLSILKSNFEVYKLLKRLDVKYPLILIIRKILRKTKQII